MTNRSTSASTIKEVLAALLIAGCVAFLASCADVDNNVFVDVAGQNSSIILVGNQEVTLNQLNSTFKYTVASDAQYQEDVKVMAAPVVKSSTVEEDFCSVLSTVNINVKGEKSSEKASIFYTINSITIYQVCADGELNLITNRMSVADNAEKVDFTLPVADTWKGRSINPDDEFENASEFSFYMIPQNVDNILIKIDYQIESNGYVVYSNIQTEKISGNWIQSKTYNYNILLANGAEKITYADPQVR